MKKIFKNLLRGELRRFCVSVCVINEKIFVVGGEDVEVNVRI